MALHPIFKRSGPGRLKPQLPSCIVLTHRHIVGYCLALGLAATVCIAGVTFSVIFMDIPDIRNVQHYRPPVASRILDARGDIVEVVSREHRIVVPLSRMPPQLVQAFVAAEDSRFFQHAGVDFWSILRAMYHNIISGRKSQGASTITQQVARSLLLTREKTYLRKLKEAILAARVDKYLTKEEILHIYLNQIYLGDGAYGVEAAARTYFQRPLGDLSLAQMALLAGLPQAPSKYTPTKYPDLARQRQQYVLARMVEEGFISADTAKESLSQPVTVQRSDAAPYESSYFFQHVKNYIADKYGAQVLAEGGLVIRTGLDMNLQRAASQALRQRIMELKAAARQGGGVLPQGGVVAMETRTGVVRALVGGRNYDLSQFDRAAQARRQPGSAIKPIIYAAALEYGMSPDTLIDDEPLSLPGGANGGEWSPQNFDGEFRGPTPLREALVHSRNVVTVRILQEIGLDRVISLAKRLGISSPLEKNLSLALGSSGMSLLELTAAYSAFANDGLYLAPQFVLRVEDSQGKTLESFSPRPVQAIDPGVAATMHGILVQVVSRGTGTAASGLGVETAGKTGTTNNSRDAWFIGYTSRMLAGVWVGFDANQSLGESATGGRIAAPVWRNFMQKSLQ